MTSFLVHEEFNIEEILNIVLLGKEIGFKKKSHGYYYQNVLTGIDI